MTQKQTTTLNHHLYRCYNNDKNTAATNTIVGSSLFDLIGKKEPDQTKSFGYVLARSEAVMESFLEVIRKKTHENNPAFKRFRISEFMKDDYYVDCELLLNTEESTKDRADIVIHFPHNDFVIVIEAKSLSATTTAKNAARQGSAYATLLGEKLRLKKDRFLVVSLTNQKEFSTRDYTCLQWSDVVDLFDGFIRKSNKNRDVYLEQDFLNYILKINGIMKYYDCEVLSIPAGKTIEAVRQVGIYECPSEEGKWKTRGEHKPLYMAFREKEGYVEKLYKVDDLWSISIAGPSFEATKEQICKADDVKKIEALKRIEEYKKIIQYDEKFIEKKWVFILDNENSIKLPHPVKYKNHNVFDETKRPLSAYFAEPDADGFVWFDKL